MSVSKPWRWVLGATLVVAAVAAIAFAILRQRGHAGLGALPSELAHRGRVAVVGGEELAGLSVEGTTLVPARTSPPLARALASADPERLPGAMREAGVTALLVQTSAHRTTGPDSPVGERLAAYRAVPTMRGVYLAQDAALYVPLDLPELGTVEQDALARVARLVLAGTPPPRISEFPPSLRSPTSVEVVVILRKHGVAKLWRSSRASSIASGLLTALGVARERWASREGALGGPLARELPTVDVEVALLVEDGTLGARSPGFVDTVITDQHGVAFDRPSGWSYALPETLRTSAIASGTKAFEWLFQDNGLPRDSLGRADLRLYRFRVLPLGSSRATAVVPSSLPK